MYVPTSIPFVSRTRAIFRSAEFGFFGVIVETRVQTPRRCGAPWRAGVFVLSRLDVRPLRMSWLTVGMEKGSLQTKGRRARSPSRTGGHGSKAAARPKLAPELRFRRVACTARAGSPSTVDGGGIMTAIAFIPGLVVAAAVVVLAFRAKARADERLRRVL